MLRRIGILVAATAAVMFLSIGVASAQQYPPTSPPTTAAPSGQLGNTAGRTGTAPTGALPRTGTGLTMPLAASAALLIGAGGVAVVASRRRRTA